mgnify:CR=1 FL=1
MSDPLIPLLHAARTGGPRLPDRAGEGLTRERVFAVQEALAATLGPVGGFKVACPPDAPIIIAPIYASDIHASPATLELPADEDVGVELEYAFRLIAPLPDLGAPDFADKLRASVELLPVFELVRSRLEEPKGASGLLKMLDNQLNGAVVFGAPIRDWQDIDVTQARASLTIGDEVHLIGAARVPGGDAFATLHKLVLVIGDHCGGLQAGQVVITGSLNGLPWVKPGRVAKGEIAGLGAVEMTLEAGLE